MDFTLNYVEESLKKISLERQSFFDHILSDSELTAYIQSLITEYSGSADPEKVRSAVSSSYMLSGFFTNLQEQVSLRKEAGLNLSEYRKLSGAQTEEKYILEDFDISYSRIIRYMPAQWHTDDFFQIYYAPDGDVPIVFRDERFILKPGFFMIITPGVTHATPCYTDDAVLEHFYLRATTFEKVFFDQLGTTSILSSFFRRALDPGNTSASYLVFDCGRDADIEHIIETLEAEAVQRLPYSSNLMNTLMTQLFILLLRRYEHTARLPLIGDIRWKHEFTEILSYIQNNCATVTQPVLSEKFGYSVRQINRIIHMCMGMNYNQFLTFLRMKKATELLERGVYSMAYIAEELGYNDVSSFYRAFKKYFRITPARFVRDGFPDRVKHTVGKKQPDLDSSGK